MTGVNQTDHIKQFLTLSSQIANNCESLTIVLQSRDCPNIKSTVEKLTEGFMFQNNEDERKMKKTQLTFQVLQAWYHFYYGKSVNKPSLVVMIADFEQFNLSCVQELITIMCSFTQTLPFVLVVGIATAFKALHNVLQPHITDQISVNIFRAETSTVMLNKILREVILTPHNPVQLSGKSMKILMDIFLFYDYSLHSFVKGYKAFLLEHFCNRPLSSLLIEIDDDSLTHEDCENIRRTCQSFRDLVESESPRKRIKLITNDEYLGINLGSLVINFKRYLFHFYCSLKILVTLIEDLPRNELGKHIRELYPICSSSDITKLDEYKEFFKLLRFTAKDKFLVKLDKIISKVQASSDDEKLTSALKVEFVVVLKNLVVYQKKISEAGMSPQKEASRATSKTKTPETSKKGTIARQEMMAKLKEEAKNKVSRTITEYEHHLWECLDYLNSLMEKYLLPIKKAPPLHEFFVLNDCQSVRRQIIGAPRGAVHNALFNPQHYLQCSCCTMSENEQILPSLPDASIAYKLHLESNKFINLYDWLQAFSMVVDVNEDDDDQIRPEVQ